MNWELYSGLGRIEVNDGVVTYELTNNDLPEEFTLRELAEDFAAHYDYSDSPERTVVAHIRDTGDGEMRFFAFAVTGEFDWDTSQQFSAY